MALLSNVIALSVATSLTNLDSSRHRATDATLERRKEGWTERWGASSSPSSASDEKSPAQSARNLADGKEDSRGPQTPSEQVMALTQHRVAWLEQLVLRDANVPHSVSNSSYSVSEATGPLPYITGCDPATGRPCLVGRRNPSCRSTASRARSPSEDRKRDGSVSVAAAAVCSCSEILEYLRTVHKVDLDCHAFDGEGGKHLVSRLDRQQMCESLAISSLIQQTLDPILSALRYCDERSYSQTYLPAAKRASLNPNGEVGVAGNRYRRAAPPFFGAVHFFPSFQPYAEKLRAVSELAHVRCSGRSLLSPGRGRDHQVDVHAALMTADEHYQALDDRLQQMMAKLDDSEAAESVGPTTAYLLGTTSPANVDALLFAHLADALADPHLLTLLPQYKHLMHFFRTVYEAYFGPDYRFDISSEGVSSSSSLTREELDELVAVNNRANDVNAYNAMGLAKALSSSAALIDAIGTTLTREDIMEAARLEKDTAGESLRRLLLGGGLYPEDESEAMSNASFFRRNKNRDSSEEGSKEGKDAGTPSAEAKMEKMKMDRKEGDTVWIVSIIAGVALVLVMSRKT